MTMMKQEVLCVFNEFCIFNNTSHASSAELLLLDINKDFTYSHIHIHIYIFTFFAVR